MRFTLKQQCQIPYAALAYLHRQARIGQGYSPSRREVVVRQNKCWVLDVVANFSSLRIELRSKN